MRSRAELRCPPGKRRHGLAPREHDRRRWLRLNSAGHPGSQRRRPSARCRGGLCWPRLSDTLSPPGSASRASVGRPQLSMAVEAYAYPMVLGATRRGTVSAGGEGEGGGGVGVVRNRQRSRETHDRSCSGCWPGWGRLTDSEAGGTDGTSPLLQWLRDRGTSPLLLGGENLPMLHLLKRDATLLPVSS